MQVTATKTLLILSMTQPQNITDFIYDTATKTLLISSMTQPQKLLKI